MRAKLALVCGCVLAVQPAARGASLLGDAATPLPGWTPLSVGAPATGLVSWDAPTGHVSVTAVGATPNGLLLSSGFNYTGDPPGAVTGDTTPAAAVDAYAGKSVDVGGHSQFDAGPASEGSAVQRTFTASPGDVLTLQFDFLSQEGSASMYQGLSEADLPKNNLNIDDFAFIAITHAGNTDVTRIADVLSPTMTDIFDPDTGERLWSHTGLLTLSFTLQPGADLTDGTYTVALGVMNGAGAAGQPAHLSYINESQLQVFGLDVTGPSAVPLPASARAGGVLLASCLAASLARRVRRAAST